MLRTQLEASLMEDESEFALAAREHRELLARHRQERERRRSARVPHGWAWLRAFRRYDEYERALARLEGASAPIHESALARLEGASEPIEVEAAAARASAATARAGAAPLS